MSVLGMPERRTHDYYRHGTTSLFAAFDIAFALGFPSRRQADARRELTRLYPLAGGEPGTPIRSARQRFGEPGGERSGGGTDPEGGHGQRDLVPTGCAQGGGCQQGHNASHRQIRAAKGARPDPLIPPRGRGLAMSVASDRYPRAHTDNSERGEDTTGLHGHEINST